MRRIAVGAASSRPWCSAACGGSSKSSSAQRRRRTTTDGGRQQRRRQRRVLAAARQGARRRTSRSRTRPRDGTSDHDRPGRQRQDRVHHRRQQHDRHRRRRRRSRATARRPTATCTDLGSRRRAASAGDHRRSFTSLVRGARAAARRPCSAGHTSTETIAGRDAKCVTYKASDVAASSAAPSVRQHRAGYDLDVTRRSASTSRPAFVLEDRRHRQTGQATDELLATAVGEPSPTATSRRRSTPATTRRCADHAPGGITIPRSRPGRSRSRACRVSSPLPTGTAARRGELPRRVAIAGAEDRHDVARPALAEADLDQRADDRSHQLPAERVAADLVAQHAVAFVDPTRLEHPPRRRRALRDPCGRTTRSRARRRTGRRPGAAPRRSSGSGTHHVNRSRNGSGTGRFRIV